jgi:hypothetical protein
MESAKKCYSHVIFGITTLLFHFHLSYNNIIFALKKISDMDKRIRLVWVLSIITMLAIFCGQTYWLYNQFVYSNDENISKLEKVCTKSLKKEFMLRETYKERHSKKGKEAKLGIRIAIKEHESNAGHYTHKTDISYILPDKKKVVDMHSVTFSQTFDISNRMLVSMVKRFQKSVLDSILIAEGYEGTSNFKFVKSKRCYAEPAFSVSGGMFKRIHVIYSSNPLSYEAVSFDIDVPTKHVVSSMAWQLAGSVLLMFILAFCLWYQMKTIMIQNRIDGIRHEFMKNMIYEMKQPSSSSEDEEAIRIGDIDFIYAINELRHGNERVIITSRQAEILRILAERRGELVTREDILEAVWGDDSYANSMALNVQITYLRRALRSDSSVLIDAVIKKGYVLKCEP